MMWSIKQHGHLFVFWRGQLIYKVWLNPDGTKKYSRVMYLPGQI